MNRATTTFTEDLVRKAARYVLGREYRRLILGGSFAILVAIAAVLGLFAGGFIPSDKLKQFLAGLIAAALVIGLIGLVGYQQSLRFCLRVFRNEGESEVGYQVSEVGCSVRYKGVEATLPWHRLKTRQRYGDYELLGFGPTENRSDRATFSEVVNAMSRGLSGPDLLGFPVFCAVPRAHTRYLLVPTALLRDNASAPVPSVARK